MRTLVTGAARGIGLGIARAIVDGGGSVIVVDIDDAALTGAAESLGAENARTLAVDVADARAVDEAVTSIWETTGPVDGLVNNAGVIEPGPALDSTPESWRHQFDVNLAGAFEMSRAVARRWIDAGTGGAIVNVASNAGKVGYRNMAAYNATKAGLINLTRTLAAEWAEFDINVNAVCPGGVDTAMLTDVAEWVVEQFGGDADEIRSSMVPEQLGRHIAPVEIGAVVRFLLSEDARIIRGQAINTDGGDTPY